MPCIFQIEKICLIFLTSLFLSLTACGSGQIYKPSSNSSHKISGQIVHEKGLPYTFQGDFVFTSDSYALVTLIQISAEDAPSKVIKEQRVDNVSSFPIPFYLEFDESVDFKRYSYQISAKVFSQKGDQLREGDLQAETVHEWTGQNSVTLKASGLELCSSAQSGGFCL